VGGQAAAVNLSFVAEDLSSLEAGALEARIADVQRRMRPVEQQLAGLRGERDVLQTEKRRRERSANRVARAEVKAAMKEGSLPSLAELVAGADPADLDAYVYNLKTGGEVRLGFPGARRQALMFTDGVQTAQAADLDEASRLHSAGWELGGPGRPGVRIHFPGTRQERLVPADEVFVRARTQ
jgi:hypothetical protein